MATTPKPSILKTPNTPGKAAEPHERNPGEAPPKAKSGGLLRWILIGAGVVILLAGLAAGGLWWKRHRGHGKTPVPAKAAVVKVSKPAAPPVTVEMPMDPFVVNLADAGGHSYARIGLTLVLLAPAEAKKSDDKSEATADTGPDLKAEARDTIITLLSEQQAADLLAVGGKEHLKQLMQQALVARDPRLKVTDIYFTEFLVQA